MKRLGGVLILCLSLCLTACQRRSYAADDQSKVRVGLVYDLGGKDDRSFDAAAWAGASRAAKEFPLVLRDVETGDAAAIEPAMRAFAERGYDLIIGVGFVQAPIVESVAKDYPKLNFALVDGVVDLPNVASLVFKEHEGSYLVGMIAALTSKSGTLGFVGGMDIPLIRKFEVGYEEGARSINPGIRILQNYIGVTGAAWNDPVRGKELTRAQIEKGADVIFAAAGPSGLGTFDAVEQYGKDEHGRARKFAIGVDSNQNWVKPGYVLTSMMKRVDNAVYQTIHERVEGRSVTGIHVYGLDNDGVGYAFDEYNKDLLSPETIRLLDEARRRIISGQIKVTNAMDK
jgi:basic membrane protein A